MIWICRRPGFWSAVRLALLSAPAGPAPTTKTSHLSRIGTWHSSQFLSVWLFLKWVELEETWYTCLGTVSVSISLGTFTVVHCSEKHVATLGISWASAGHLLRHLLRHLRLHTINSVATSRRYDLCVFFLSFAQRYSKHIYSCTWRWGSKMWRPSTFTRPLEKKDLTSSWQIL